MSGEKTARLGVLGCAFALGITWGICILFVGWFSMLGWATPLVKIVGSAYIGYTASFFGAILGGIWGFFDGFIGGVIFSFLYNKLKR